ncbi:uncharacterized protein PHALS_09558 [Plasmopara halstedii]|uniref:Polyprotein n=1 Tax=Plasmopara halstedii TaxID=4781 RepID=A0A0P1A5M6_PLAHL|nr:uncharacterized protein PHALS_09558 [Plasmopara halstedii]CEG35437.1 hypothetical protein PHALS_09558 [Plasmopara halstedii]|eukprot:XP_024571806.1 hypothetical protein PHALS_09558 [Plasmopara halstedii]
MDSAIPPHRLQQVDHLETGTEIWAEVNEIYERLMDPLIKESIILRKCDELKELKCSPTGDMSIHLAEMLTIKSAVKSYGYEFKDINMRQMMLGSLPDLYQYEQLRGALLCGKGNRATNTGSGQRQLHGGSTGAHHQQQNGSKKNQHGDGQRKPKRDRKNKTCHWCNEINHIQADGTAIIDGVAGPGAAATSGGNIGTNTGTQRRQQRSYCTSHGGEVRADRRGVVKDEQGVAAGVAMVSPMLAVPDTKSSNVHLTGDRSVFVHLQEIHPERIGANFVGVAVTTLTRASGIGRVKIITEVGDAEAEVFLVDVLYLEGASHRLFSIHLAIATQNFEISYDRAASTITSRGCSATPRCTACYRQLHDCGRCGHTRAVAQPDWTHECSISQDHGGSWTRARRDDHKQAAQDV